MFLLVISVFHSILAFFGILSNCILIFLAVWKTPKSIGTYSILIIVRATVDFLACFFDIFSQSRPIPSGLTLGIASSGLCKHVNAWLCFLGYSLQLHFHSLSLHLLVVCFAFRYYVLLERYPKANQLFLLIVLLYFPSFFQALFLLIDNNRPEDVRLLVQIHHPEYRLKDLVVNGHSDLRHFPSVLAYLLLIIPSFPVCLLIRILRRKIHQKLRNAILRPDVRENHRQLTFALSAQALLPLIFLVSLLLFLLAQFKLVESPVLESSILLLAVLVPTLNPLFSIALIRPYRETVMRFIGLDPKEWSISKDSSVAPGSSSSVFGTRGEAVLPVAIHSHFRTSRPPFDRFSANNQSFALVKRSRGRKAKGRRQTPGPAMSQHSGDGDGETKAARNDNLTHVLFAQETVGDDKKDSAIIDVMIDQFKDENLGNIQPNAALATLGVWKIKQVVLGPSHIGILLDDDNVCRIPYSLLQVQTGEVKEAEQVRGETSRTRDEYRPSHEVEVIPLSGGLSSLRTATGTAKYRRVMLSNSAACRAYYRLRGNLGDGARGYILGTSRSSVPAANVPEDLINNVQQVLQGKSREVIIRELQRTGLNVNEAVNNLLSRDDGDDGMDIGGEHIIPEELLHILEGSVGQGTGAGNGVLAESFLDRVLTEERLMDTLTSRSDMRYHYGPKKPKSSDKDKKKKDAESCWKNCIQLEDNIEWWCGESGAGIPEHALTEEKLEEIEGKSSPVVSITATSYQMYVLHKNGKMYSWGWKENRGTKNPMTVVRNPLQPEHSIIATDADPVVQMSSSNLRVAVLTRLGHIVTWLDESGVGVRVSQATETINKIGEDSVIKVQDLVTSDHLSAFRIESIVHWCGIVPLLEGSRHADKEKAEREKKKHVSFGDATTSGGQSNALITHEIVKGSLVQMKKAPLYPAGSVAAHIDTSYPMVGVLLEDCWNMTDHCRFRCLTPEEYDYELEVEGFLNSLNGPSESGTPAETDPGVRVEQSRKRSADESSHTLREPPFAQPADFGRRRIEIWLVEDLVWIHEHRKRDVLIVDLENNGFVCVRPNAPLNPPSPYQSIYSDRLEMEGIPPSIAPLKKGSEEPRLMRKDDVQLAEKRSLRSSVILQKELLKFDVDSNRTVVSMIADLNELRVLVRSKHSERGMHMYRVGMTGKVISRRRVPVFLPAVERPIPPMMTPKLISFGDARTIFLRDTAGQLIPLQRDALNGFRDIPAMHSQPIIHIATAWRPTLNILASCEKNAQWQGSMIVIPGVNRPWHRNFVKDGSSLMQCVLYCDVDGVTLFLDRLLEMRMNETITHHEFRMIMGEQLFGVSSDLCSNVLHAAIRLTTATKNADDMDKAVADTFHPVPFATKNVPPPQPPPQPQPSQEVPMEEDSIQGASEEQGTSSAPPQEGEGGEESRWGRVLRSRPKRQTAPPARKTRRSAEKPIRMESEDPEDNTGENNSFSSIRSEESGLPFASPKSPELRQRMALLIVDILLKHPAMLFDKNADESIGYLDELDRTSAMKCLLLSRDLNGMTPFQSAINQRAYGAAYSIWKTLLQLNFISMSEDEKLMYIFPGFTADESHNADDSPLFILCYNDVCSFTWTGEDHINQDIYECKTCGLTGSLCCCSECALTCHRNHDCRLKRTSPTAYCDCWEKSSCSCKALIAGNELLREHLLSELLKYTRLYELPNARNEHIVLFLSRIVIRQTREQLYSQKRRARYRGPPPLPSSGTPEHNLQPPKFARNALELCCNMADVVLNAIKFGISNHGPDDWATPGQLEFLQQSSSTHLDKLAFVMANKVMKEFSTYFVGTLRHLLSQTSEDPDANTNIELVASRFVRSLVRVLTLSINISPLAPSTILSAEDQAESQSRDNREDRVRYNAAGFPTTYPAPFSSILIAKKESSKMSEKAASFVAMINRIMHFLQQLPTFAVVQLAIAADAAFEPVRDGMLRPMVNPAQAGSNSDPMDILDKYFSTDLSFNEVIKRSKGHDKSSSTTKTETKRVRRSSRRDTDRENGSENSLEDERSAGDRVSESQDTSRVRNDSVATSNLPTPRRRRLLSGNTTNDTNEDNEERTGEPRREVDVESSSADDDNDDEDDEDEDDNDDDNDDDEDNDDDDDEDSERPAEERQEDEAREEVDEQDEQEEVVARIRAAEEEQAREAVPERDEEEGWQPYEPESPRRDFDDGSSDSQEGAAAREPAFVIAEVAHPLDAADAQQEPEPVVRERSGADIDLVAAQASLSAARERALAEYEAATGRRMHSTRGPSAINRVSTYYAPYRVPRGLPPFSSRRDDANSGTGSSALGTGSSSSANPANNQTQSSNAAATSRATSAVPAATGATTSTSNQNSSPSGSNSSKKSDNAEQPSLEAAREQLALTFSILVRAGCDILSRMPRPVLSVYTKADDNAKRCQLKAQRIFSDILEETFRWMGRVFESTEAKIAFNETYEKSLIRPISPQTDDKRGRKESLNYVHTLLRLATDEAKDSAAFVDVEMLYPVAFIADAFFNLLNCNAERPIDVKMMIDNYEDCQRRQFRMQCMQTDPDLMIGFYIRPYSLSWPGHLHDGAWDTLSGRYHINETLKAEAECPMLGGPKILTMQSRREDLFREPMLDDAKRKTLTITKAPIEEFTLHLQNRPFEYRRPGSSMTMAPHRSSLEREFGSITRDFFFHSRTPDDAVKDYALETKKNPGCLPHYDNTVSVFKEQLLRHSAERENLYFSKWHKTLGIIGKHFYDKIADAFGADVAFENSILLRRLATFDTKHKLFNKATEKYRTQYSTVKEIVLDVRRDPSSLFRDTMTQLNSLYVKKMMSVRSLESNHSPLAGTRLRVHFVDEPGEGTGVTRSFYTAFAESCMMDVAPFAVESQAERSSLIMQVLYPRCDYDHDSEVSKTVRKARREQAIRLRTHLHRLKTFPLNLAAPRFDIKNFTGEGNWTKKVLVDSSAESQPVAPLNWGQHEETLRKIHDMTFEFVNDDKIIGRVMGIMCQLPTEFFVNAVNNDDTMRLHIQQILSELRAEGEFDDGPFNGFCFSRVLQQGSRSDEEQWNVVVGTEYPLTALFEKNRAECYVPKLGNEAPVRFAAFRTVGRIMGICLSQGDIFPMRFGRHVFAYILKEPICFLDLAFHDIEMFNSLRKMFSSDLKGSPNEYAFAVTQFGLDGKPFDTTLRPNGDETIVSSENVLEYVYKYTEHTLLGKRAPAFEAIREGILDVIPESMLFGLTPEDLRLLICGIESVSISVLQENTTFLDESRASQEILSRFKQWFWQVIESFTPQEKMDLVFFWTGSPSLPAAGKWQSAASVMLRPPEDVFLPTANTCISRIYVPVYSSKRILKSKLLMAIKAKNFGFV
ncbi:unnamed protein product [Caenorhabditis sp. 36 PRJEB53466]|nr:unnamed protein product [Caenorhabditis sp. 36 PRJEB53466]